MALHTPHSGFVCLRAVALCALLMVGAITEVFAAAIIIDNFSGTNQLGPRSFVSSQGGGMGSPPTFGESGGWGTINLNPVNSIVSGTLTYTAAGTIDLTGGGTNSQFLMEFVAVIAEVPTGFTQVSNLQITIHTTSGVKQYSGIGVGEGQTNQALPFTSFTGSGNLAQVTSVDLAFFSVSNMNGGSIVIDRVWASPLAGAVPTAPGASFVAVTPSPTPSTAIHYTLNFTNNQGAAPIEGLTASDLTVSGTAGATTATVNGSVGSSYDIAITGMTGDGTVAVSLGASTITDLWQQANPSGASSPSIDYVRPPVFTNGPPPNSIVLGTPYGPFTYAAVGKPPITYAVSSGSLPPPLSLSSGGTISGTPTTPGLFTGVTRATNVGSTDQAFSITVVCPTIVVGPPTLPNPVEYSPYSQSLGAAGPPGSYAFAVTSGALPGGMTLSSAGVLSGPATSKVPATFTVTATGPAGLACSGSRAYSMTAQPAAIVVAPTTLPSATSGTPYSQNITASGSPGPFTFAVTAGSPPAGTNLSSAGILSGILTTPATYNFTVKGTDGDANSGTQAYTVTVAPNPTAQSISFGPAPQLVVGASAILNVSASSGLPVSMSSSTPATCTLSGNSVLGVAVGTCTIAANQPGDGVNYYAAPQATSSFPVGLSAIDVRSYVPAIDTSGDQSLLRVINIGNQPTGITVAVIDGPTGILTPGSVLVSALPAGAARNFSATQVEAALGRTLAAGSRPRIRVSSTTAMPIEVQSILVDSHGLYSDVSGAQSGSAVNVRTYVPAATQAFGYTSLLRVINTGGNATPVTVARIDPVSGIVGVAGTLNASLPAGAAITYSAAQIESAMGPVLAAADRPRIRVSAPASTLDVQSFLMGPDGSFSEVSSAQTGSTVNVRSYWPAASQGYTSFVRVINADTLPAAISVSLIDPDSGTVTATGSLIGALAAGAAKTVTSAEVEQALGVSIPAGTRPRLSLSSASGATLEVQSFLSQPNGRFDEMSNATINSANPSIGNGAEVRLYVPVVDSNAFYSSSIRVINTGSTAAWVYVTLIDDTTGTAAGSGNVVIPNLAAGAARTLSARTIETALGFSNPPSPMQPTIPSGSRPRLVFGSSAAIEVQSLLNLPGGVVTEVSGSQ